MICLYRGLLGVGDGAVGPGAVGSNGGHQGDGRGPGPSPSSRARHGDQFDVLYVYSDCISQVQFEFSCQNVFVYIEVA